MGNIRCNAPNITSVATVAIKKPMHILRLFCASAASSCSFFQRTKNHAVQSKQIIGANSKPIMATYSIEVPPFLLLFIIAKSRHNVKALSEPCDHLRHAYMCTGCKQCCSNNTPSMVQIPPFWGPYTGSFGTYTHSVVVRQPD